ncbi:MAG TPA: hypothetical protein VF181_02015, partial [Balneolaceae bacterium]
MRHIFSLIVVFFLMSNITLAQAGNEDMGAEATEALLLKNYRPESLYILPEYKADKARFKAIDMHSHPYPKTEQEIEEWVQTMKENNIQK